MARHSNGPGEAQTQVLDTLTRVLEKVEILLDRAIDKFKAEERPVITKFQCPKCRARTGKCPECGARYAHGSGASACREPACQKMNTPIDCVCGLSVVADGSGVLTTDGVSIPWKKG